MVAVGIASNERVDRIRRIGAAGQQGVIIYDVRNPAQPRRAAQFQKQGSLVASEVAVRLVSTGDSPTAAFVVYVANKRGPALLLECRETATSCD